MAGISISDFTRVTGLSVADCGHKRGQLDTGDVVTMHSGSRVSYEDAVQLYFSARAGNSSPGVPHSYTFELSRILAASPMRVASDVEFALQRKFPDLDTSVRIVSKSWRSVTVEAKVVGPDAESMAAAKWARSYVHRNWL